MPKNRRTKSKRPDGSSTPKKAKGKPTPRKASERPAPKQSKAAAGVKPPDVPAEPPFELPPLPDPIDPDNPVRPLGKWLESMAIAIVLYQGWRRRLTILVFDEYEAAQDTDEEYRGIRARTRSRAELEAARKYSGAVVRSKAARIILPSLDRVVARVDECIDQVAPIIDGIHIHLRLSGGATTSWETQLAVSIRELRETIKADRLLLSFDGPFGDAAEFREASKRTDLALRGLYDGLQDKAKHLASVAIAKPSAGAGQLSRQCGRLLAGLEKWGAALQTTAADIRKEGWALCAVSMDALRPDVDKLTVVLEAQDKLDWAKKIQDRFAETVKEAEKVDELCISPGLHRRNQQRADQANNAMQDARKALWGLTEFLRSIQTALTQVGAEPAAAPDMSKGADRPSARELRCAPMSKSEIARRYLKRDKAKPIQVKAFMLRQDLRQEPGVRLFTIRIDNLAADVQARFTRKDR